MPTPPRSASKIRTRNHERRKRRRHVLAPIDPADLVRMRRRQLTANPGPWRKIAVGSGTSPFSEVINLGDYDTRSAEEEPREGPLLEPRLRILTACL
jgi:hypothetical protein